jgi:RsmE family RNA methyltransferase
VAHPDAEFIGSNGFKTDGDIFIAVGPEGGFSSQELADLKGSNFNFVRLSANILRVETACIFFVGLLNYFSNAG